MFVFFFLISTPVLVVAEEEVLLPSVSAYEVLTWKERHLLTRLANGVYVIKFTNPDPAAKVKEAIGFVDMVLTQVTPTFNLKSIMRLYVYLEDEVVYRYQEVNGQYIGGPTTLPYFMLEDDPEDEELKPADPSDSVPDSSTPAPPKEKEVRGGKEETMYS